jgi:hypothetical protein
MTRIYKELKKLNLKRNQWPNEEMGKWTKKSFSKGRSINGQKTHEEMVTIPGNKEKVIETSLRFTSFLLE